MEHTNDKTSKTKTQSVSNSLVNKTIQNKAIELQDNRPASILQRKANNTGLPDNLKSGIENLSGHSMDDVKVHYNSDKPRQLNAHAYAQGTDIHIASGQEKHLAHEAWHVIQQKQGRVKPTLQMKGKVNVNDDKGLEKEADVMGSRANETIQNKEIKSTSSNNNNNNNNIVQRFTVIKPTDYQKAGANQEKMFPMQRLDRHKTSKISGSFVNVTKHINWVQGYSETPPLKVSQHGLLAIQSTTNQPKTFYGEANSIADFRKKLIDIKSRVTLKTAGNSINVPKNPAKIGAAKNTLSMVVPVLSKHMDPAEQLMDNSECDSVSSKIVGGKHMVIGNSQTGTKRLESVSVRENQISHVAKAVTMLQPGENADNFAQHYTHAKQNELNLHDANRAIKPEVTKYFAKGLLRRTHLIPTAKILRALSAPGVPKDVWKQVYELHVGKTEQERPDDMDILPHIEKMLNIQDLHDYHTASNNNIQGRLGINSHASPEVGESFSIMGQGGPMVTNEHGAISHELDISNKDKHGVQNIMKEMMALQTSALRLGILSNQQYKLAKGTIPFAEHHAAVVAKDGEDTVTFENYNRVVESDVLKEALWNSLFAEFDKFDKNIKVEIKNIREAISNVQKDQTIDPYTKASRIFAQKEQHIEILRQKFLVVSNTTGLSIKTNLGEENNALWHFNMYGPSHSTFTNEKGVKKQQSFHDTWKDSVPNAITVRTLGLADKHFKTETINNIKYRIANLAFNMIKKDHFKHVTTIFMTLQNILLSGVEQAETRPEVANALKSVRTRLANLEKNYPDLDEKEKGQAKILLDQNKTEILKNYLQIRQEMRQEKEKIEFNKNMSERLINSHPDLSKKYINWSLEAENDLLVLQEKSSFFKGFILP